MTTEREPDTGQQLAALLLGVTAGCALIMIWPWWVMVWEWARSVLLLAALAR